MSFDLGNVTAYAGVPFTLLVSYKLVLPWLTGWSRAYYVFLLTWTIPYIVGNVCDSNKIGPQWIQYHLLDTSYVQWATTLGVTFYVVAMKLARRPYTQRSILISSGISLAAFLVMAYVWEAGQSWLAWREFGSAIDWSDYTYYAVSTALTLLPFIAFPRHSVANAQALV